MNEKIKPFFVFSEGSMGSGTRYYCATYARERSAVAAFTMAVYTALLPVMVLLLMNGSLFHGSEMRQAWNLVRLPALIIVILAYPIVAVCLVTLFLFVNEKAWDSTLIGGRYIRNRGKYTTSEWAEAYSRNGVKRVAEEAYYFDDRLKDFAGRRKPVGAKVYDDFIEVGKGARQRKYYYDDVYKAFWGAGLVVLRFAGEDGPHDVVLEASGMNEGERKAFDSFVLERLPTSCRRYRSRVVLFHSRAFRRNPVYDVWDRHLAGKGKVVHFKLYDQRLEDEEVFGSFDR